MRNTIVGCYQEKVISFALRKLKIKPKHCHRCFAARDCGVERTKRFVIFKESHSQYNISYWIFWRFCGLLKKYQSKYSALTVNNDDNFFLKKRNHLQRVDILVTWKLKWPKNLLCTKSSGLLFQFIYSWSIQLFRQVLNLRIFAYIWNPCDFYGL